MRTRSSAATGARAVRRAVGGLRQSWSGPHELVLFGAAYLTYFGVRALTEGAVPRAVVNARTLFGFERDLGLTWERPLQRLALRSATLRDVADWIYIWGHWPVLIVGGVLLFNLARPQYYRLRNVCLLSGAIGLIVFALFPLAPPRLAGLGFVDTITLHNGAYRTVLPPSLVNEYAAMPSFHAGWNLMLGIALFRATANLAVRVFAVLMPAAMGFATVATANHFVLDVLAGAALVLGSVAVVDRFKREPPRAADDPPSLRGRDVASPHGRVRGRARGERSPSALKRHTST